MEYRETCCCGAQLEINSSGVLGAVSARIQEFRDAHQLCRKAQVLRQIRGDSTGPRWAEVDCGPLPDLDDPQ